MDTDGYVETEIRTKWSVWRFDFFWFAINLDTHGGTNTYLDSMICVTFYLFFLINQLTVGHPRHYTA